MSSFFGLIFGSNGALGVLQSRAHAMTGNIHACFRGFQHSIVSTVRDSGMVFYGSLGPLRNEELLCDYHQLFVKCLDLSERKESSKQL